MNKLINDNQFEVNTSDTDRIHVRNFQTQIVITVKDETDVAVITLPKEVAQELAAWLIDRTKM